MIDRITNNYAIALPEGSLFSNSSPAGAFQVWLLVYVYLLPIMLYASRASLRTARSSPIRPDVCRVIGSSRLKVMPL